MPVRSTRTQYRDPLTGQFAKPSPFHSKILIMSYGRKQWQIRAYKPERVIVKRLPTPRPPRPPPPPIEKWILTIWVYRSSSKEKIPLSFELTRQPTQADVLRILERIGYNKDFQVGRTGKQRLFGPDLPYYRIEHMRG